MHGLPAGDGVAQITPPKSALSTLDFMWVELTSRCNLTCTHCYTSSSPMSGGDDVLTRRDYERVLTEAHAVGCRSVQFIGGEPQLNRSLCDLTSYAVGLGFKYVEIFSNLTRLDRELMKFAAVNRIRFATSFYSDRARNHDAFTGVPGSYLRTLANIKLLRSSNIKLRVGIIAVGQSSEEIARAQQLLKSEGIEDISVDRVRRVGRANTDASPSGYDELCGNCWSGKLCVTPGGVAYPCTMSRNFPVGDVTMQTVSEIVDSVVLRRFRANLYSHSTKQSDLEECVPRVLNPYPKCSPAGCAPDIKVSSAGYLVSDQ